MLKTAELELLRAIRGRWSQNRLSERLGFRFNQIYRWETAYTQISWKDFVRLCAARKANLSSPLHGYLGYGGSLEDGTALVSHLLGPLSLAEAASRMGVSAYTIRSWKSGRTRTLLETVLRIMSELQNFLPEFVEHLVGPDAVPSLAAEIARRKKQRRFLFDYPMGNAALHFLGLDEIAERPYPEGYLARKLGLSLSDERKLLEKMLEAEIVAKVEGRYRDLARDLETSGGFKDGLRVRRFWAEKVVRFMDSLKAKPERTLSAITSYEASDDACKRIRSAHFEYLTKVYQILQTDPGPKERAVVQLFQMLDLEELGQVVGTTIE